MDIHVGDMIDADLLFQTLLTNAGITGLTVMGEVDTDSFKKHPYVVHYSIPRELDNRGLWEIHLTLTVVAADDVAFGFANKVSRAVGSWNQPPNGSLLNLGMGIQSVESRSAFSRVGQGVRLEQKTLTTYSGSWAIIARTF